MYVGLGDIIKFGRVRFRIRKLCLNFEDEENESGEPRDVENMDEYLSKNFRPNQNNEEEVNNTEEHDATANNIDMVSRQNTNLNATSF